MNCEICPCKKECDTRGEDMMYNPELYEDADYDICLYEDNHKED